MKRYRIEKDSDIIISDIGFVVFETSQYYIDSYDCLKTYKNGIKKNT